MQSCIGCTAQMPVKANVATLRMSMMTDWCVKYHRLIPQQLRQLQVPAKAMHCCCIMQHITTVVLAHLGHSITQENNSAMHTGVFCPGQSPGTSTQYFRKTRGTACSSRVTAIDTSTCFERQGREARQWCQAVRPVSHDNSPSSSLMPHSVTICLARLVACCRSLRAPEVTASRPKMTSSATLPPMHTSMRASICRLLWLNSSLSGSCTPHATL